MKVLTKVLLVLAISTPLGASAVTYAVKQNMEKNHEKADITSSSSEFTMTGNGYTFTLSKKNMQFSISKGTQTWESGIVDEKDNETTYSRLGFLEGPISVSYMDAKAGEKAYYPFTSGSNGRLKTTMKNVSFSNSEDTIIATMKLFNGDNLEKSGFIITLNLNYQLADDGLKIWVDNIEEQSTSLILSKIWIYPGMGMSYKQVPEKILIPDGSGAIIDLSKRTHAKSSLTMSTYGKDMGIASSTRTIYSGEQLSMPMYAIYGQNKALMATVDSGQEYSELNAKVATMSDDYNAAYFGFNYREQTYKYTSLDENARQSLPQEKMNDFVPMVHYHLYDEGLEYYDVAKKYREYLIKENMLNDERYGDANVRLEFLMSENKKALFGNEVIKMTTANYIRNKVLGLTELGNDWTVSLKGYTSGGFGGSYPNTFPLEGKTGSSSDYTHLATALGEKDIAVNYNVDVVRSFKSSGSSLAMNMSEMLISSYDYVNGTNQRFTRLTPTRSANLVKKQANNLNKLKGSGFDFTSIGYDLFSTYKNEKNTRSDSIVKYQNALKEFDKLKNVRKPNLYLYPYFQNYLDAPTSASKYMIETESIPFLQMVLSGYKGFYSSPINLNYLGEKQLLELVDYNIYPSYLLTEEDSIKLVDSPSSSYIYSSQYDIWESDLKNAYSAVIGKLKNVEGACFLKREQVANKVYKNTYDNNKCIIINYSSNTYTFNGKDIAPLSSEVFDL